MADTIPKKLFDAAIKESVYLDKYSAGLAKDVRKLLDDAQNEIVAAIAKNDPTAPTMTKWKAARLEKLNEEISTILGTKYGEIKKDIDLGLKKVGSVQAKSAVKTINGIVGVDVFNVTLTNDNVKAIVENTMIQGNIIGDWWDKQSDSVKSKLSAQMAAGTQAIQIGLVQGESIGDLIARVRGTALKPGIIAATKREATALVRTSVMQVANAVRQETYKKNADVLDGIEWLSTLDARTTPLCQALDGKQFDMELNPIDHDMEYPGGPPCHFQCRSTTLPLLKSWNELIGPKSKLNKKQIDVLEKMPQGMRDTINGPIPMNMTYNDWLLTQPINIQQEILGKGKWKLWSENKLSVSDLVDNTGKPLTIKELSEKLGVVYEEAVSSIAETGAAASISDWVAVRSVSEAPKIFKDQFNVIKLNIDKAIAVRTGDQLKAVNLVGKGLSDATKIAKGNDFLLDVKKAGRSAGLYSPSEKKITVSISGRLGKADMLSIGNKNYLVGGDISSTARHEYGHHTFYGLTYDQRVKWKTFHHSKGHDWWKDNVSQYSAKSSSEGFAESFSAYSSPLYGVGKNRTLPKEIEDLFVDLFGKREAVKAVTKEAVGEIEDAARIAAAAAKKDADLLAAIKDPTKTVTFRPGDPLPAGTFQPVKAVEIPKTVVTSEPKFPATSKRPGAGVIMIEDDGRVWIVAPKDKFGGVEYTFAKGGVEGGLTTTTALQEAAIREIFEETGLQCKILGHLGDYERKTSTVRYYIGKRVGGSPTMMGSESERVLLVTRSDLKSLLKASADFKIADDLEATYKRAMALGEGDFAKGLEVLVKDVGFKTKLDDLISEFPELSKIEFADDLKLTFAQKLKIAEEKLDGKIVSRVETWSSETGTSGSVAYGKYASVIDEDPRRGYKLITAEMDKLEKEAADKMLSLSFSEKEALKSLEKSGMIYEGEAPYSSLVKIRKMSESLVKDAKDELAVVSKTGSDSIEKEVYDKLLLKKSTWDPVELLSETKEITRSMVRDAEMEMATFVSRMTSERAILIKNEIALIDPTFTTMNFVKQMRLIKALSDEVDGALTKIDDILAKGSADLRIKYLSSVPKDYTVTKRLEELKKLESETRIWEAVESRALKAAADEGKTAGKLMKDYSETEMRMIYGGLKSSLVKGKIPKPGSKVMSLWEDLASVEKKRVLEMWVRKGAVIPDEFLTKYIAEAVSATPKVSDVAAIIGDAVKTAKIPGAGDVAKKLADEAISLIKPETAGRLMKDLSDSDMRMIAGALKGRLLKGVVPPSSTKMMTLWEELASSEKKRLIDMWVRKGAKIPDEFVAKYYSGEIIASAPKTVSPVSKTTKLSLSDFKQYAPQRGSNPGGFYVSKDNPADRWYFKFPNDQNKVKNEILSGRLYEAAGVEVPELLIVEGEGGKLGVASRIMDGVESAESTLVSGSIRAGVRENFVVDAWLGNWDVVGAGYDNLLLKDGARFVRVDVGGSLLYRARGSLKGSAFGNMVEELTTMRSGSRNPQAVAVFERITDAELKAGAAKVIKLKDSQIRNLVSQFGPGDFAEQTKLADTLIARKNYIKQYFAEVDTSAKAPTVVELAPNQIEALKYTAKIGQVDDHIASELAAGARSYVEGIDRNMVKQISKKLEEDLVPCHNIRIDKDGVFNGLMKDPVLKNQFVQGRGTTSSGSKGPYKGSVRDNWEKKLSGGALQDDPVYRKMRDQEYFTGSTEGMEAAYRRPVYGFILDDPNRNVASQYGDLTAVFKPEVRKRISFTMGNSSSLGYSEKRGMLGNAKGNYPLVQRLLENARKDNGAGLKAWLKGEKKLSQITFGYGDYIEAQIYGKTYLNRDVQYLVWRSRGDIPDRARQLADRLGVKIYSQREFMVKVAAGEI